MIKMGCNQSRERGFTIIELMMATTVLSVILLLTTVVMMNIGRLYYKGISQSRTQDNVRNINDEIAEHLQLSDKDPIPATAGSTHAWCIGGTRYTYVLDTLIGDDAAAGQSKHVLWRDDNPTPGSCSTTSGFLSAAVPSAGGAELLGAHSRLAAFNISATSPYTVSVAVAYGIEDDMFTGSGMGIRCADASGNQFCATAHMESAVTRRVIGH